MLILFVEDVVQLQEKRKVYTPTRDPRSFLHGSSTLAGKCAEQDPWRQGYSGVTLVYYPDKDHY